MEKTSAWNLEVFEQPVPVQAYHDSSRFDSREPALDDWLRQRALRSHRDGAARTYVSCLQGVVAGYYSLAVGSLERSLGTGRVRRNMPQSIPVMLLARLAVDRQWQGRGLGFSLLQDAAGRTLQAADIAGIRAMAVHVISQEAKRFYQHFGFQESMTEPMTLMVTLGNLHDAL